jgi:hypothetical protein
MNLIWWTILKSRIKALFKAKGSIAGLLTMLSCKEMEHSMKLRSAAGGNFGWSPCKANVRLQSKAAQNAYREHLREVSASVAVWISDRNAEIQLEVIARAFSSSLTASAESESPSSNSRCAIVIKVSMQFVSRQLDEIPSRRWSS